MENNIWENCPNCKGKGYLPLLLPGQNSIPGCFVTNYNSQTCKVCNGKRIISKLTGKPPIDSLSKDGK